MRYVSEEPLQPGLCKSIREEMARHDAKPLPPLAPDIAALLTAPTPQSRLPISPEVSMRQRADIAAQEAVERIKEGQITGDEVNAILGEIRAHLLSPKGTTRNDRLEDETVLDFAHRALVGLWFQRGRYRSPADQARNSGEGVPEQADLAQVVAEQQGASLPLTG